MTTSSRDIYQTITDKIIQTIEAGMERNAPPLWNGAGANGLPYNQKSKKCYSGVNVLMAWMAAQEAGYATPAWLTFNQARELGGTVRKGSKGTQIVFFNKLDRAATDPDTGDTTTKQIGFLKTYTVFNVEQCDGLNNDTNTREPFASNDAAEAIMQNCGANIIEQAGKAFFSPARDEVYLPDRARFERPESFYSVAMHELTHWTGGAARLARDFSRRFGEEAYAFEELTAELGASFVCSDLGLLPQTLTDHSRYIESWLKVLKNDKKAIFTAASQASKAHAFLLNSINAVS